MIVIRVFVLFLMLSSHVVADVCATDDNGVELCLPGPAQRIVTLSPGATELAFAAGAGEQVIAVVDYSDYPPEAEMLPNVVQCHPSLKASRVASEHWIKLDRS